MNVPAIRITTTVNTPAHTHGIGRGGTRWTPDCHGVGEAEIPLITESLRSAGGSTSSIRSRPETTFS
jgi:hypothetical protein